MRKVSIATVALQKRYGDRETIRISKEMGADAIDFSLEDFKGRYDYRNKDSIYSKSIEEITAYFSDLKAYADELGIEICQTHGRGSGFINDKAEDDALVENARLDCLATSILGAPVCVVHAVTTMFHPDASPEFMHELNFDMFTRIIPYAKEYGIKIATETFGDVHGGKCCDFFGNIDEFIKAYERVCEVDDFKNYFTVCMDTGHTNKATKFNNNPKVQEAIRKIGSDITVLHLNDNDTSGDQHLLPFVAKFDWPINGTIDWDETFDALDSIGYNGVYNMELRMSSYGIEIMPEFGAFAISVMRNYINKRYGK